MVFIVSGATVRFRTRDGTYAPDPNLHSLRFVVLSLSGILLICLIAMTASTWFAFRGLSGRADAVEDHFSNCAVSNCRSA
jgi:hypothetical protein